MEHPTFPHPTEKTHQLILIYAVSCLTILTGYLLVSGEYSEILWAGIGVSILYIVLTALDTPRTPAEE